MDTAKTAVRARLQREILMRQGLQKNTAGMRVDMGIGMLEPAFPDGSFPLSAVHEFCCRDAETQAATTGFVSGLLSPLLQRNGTLLWISPSRSLFPPAFAAFGIAPDRIIFVHLPREKDVLWMMEEALQCDCLTAVVGEIRHLDFTASRRLQLAVEQSRVTGFVIRQTTHPGTNACVSRWQISSAPSTPRDGLPGIGFPGWNVDLLKMRNGKPGSWQLEWAEGRFREIEKEKRITYTLNRQAI